MVSHDFDEFRGLIQGLAKVFPRKQLDDDAIQFYWRALKDQPIEIVRQCVGSWQRYGKRFPVPGDLRPATDKVAVVRGEDAGFQASVEQNKRHWDGVLTEHGDLGRLLLADALLGRYSLDPDVASGEKVDALRRQVGQIVRRVAPADILGDARLTGLVRHLFGQAGVERLYERFKEAA